jgi:hypothetical protein
MTLAPAWPTQRAMLALWICSFVALLLVSLGSSNPWFFSTDFPTEAYGLPFGYQVRSGGRLLFFVGKGLLLNTAGSVVLASVVVYVAHSRRIGAGADKG